MKSRVIKIAMSALMVCATIVFSATAFAQNKNLEQQILQEVAAGRDARVMIDEYHKNQLKTTSIGVDRAAELRQLHIAEQALADALSNWQMRRTDSTFAEVEAVYLQWKAAVIVIESRQKGIESKLQKIASNSAYLSLHRDVTTKLIARLTQIKSLLDPVFSSKEKFVSKDVNGLVKTVIVLLTPKLENVKRESILHANSLPVTAANLPSRTPKLSPAITPSYVKGTEVESLPVDLQDSSEAPLSEEITKQAKVLGNDYIRIYEFVRNHHKTEWYSGSVKGALGTLRSKAGNDVDQASLLIALLRATGVATRYVHGVVEFDTQKLANELGLTDSSTVASALTKAGIAFSPVVRGGRLAAVQLEHTWVTAKVPYTNYRGAVVDGSGQTWIPLDPSTKVSTWTASNVSMTDVGTANEVQNAYLSQVRRQSFGEFLKKQLTDVLQARSGAASDYTAQFGKQELVPLNLSLLPNSLPYVVVAVTHESPTISPSNIVNARVQIRSGNQTVLDALLPVHEISNQRLTISYIPATIEDHRLSLSFGGFDATPLYLMKLRPQIRVGGKVRTIGSGSVVPGSDLSLQIDLTGPFGSQKISQTVMAGAYQALAFSGTGASRPASKDPADSESKAAQILDGLAFAYQQLWNEGDAQIAALTGVRVVRPLPSLTLVSNRMQTVYLNGAPQTLEWRGVSLDAIAHPIEAIGANAKDFLLLSSLHGSSLESVLFQNQLSVDAISADKGFALAKEQSIPTLNVSQQNLNAIDGTDHSLAVKDHIRNLVRQAYRVEVPARRLQYQAWNGSVWRATEEATGAGGYFISGGLAGGEVATGENAWTLGFLADALRSPNSDGANNDPLAGVQLLSISSLDNEIGIAGQVMPLPLNVMVLDKDGFPVQGASVLFQMIAGGGLLNGAATYTATTNALGIASATVTLGQKTAESPMYMRVASGDKYLTKLGQNMIDMSVLSADGMIRIETPVTIFAKPDVLSDIVRTSEKKLKVKAPTASGSTLNSEDDLATGIFIGQFGAMVADQYGNPIANIPVALNIETTLRCNSYDDSFFRGSVLFDNSVNDQGRLSNCPTNMPILGECGNSSFSAMSSTQGSVNAGIISSNAWYAREKIAVQAGPLQQKFDAFDYYDDAKRCYPDFGTYAGRNLLTGLISDDRGVNVSGAKLGSEYKRPIELRFVLPITEEITRISERTGKPEQVGVPFQKLISYPMKVDFHATSGGSTSGVTQTGPSTYQTRLTVGNSPAQHFIDAQAIEGTLRDDKIDYFTYGFGPISAVLPKIESISSINGNHLLLDANGNSSAKATIEYSISPPEYTALGVKLRIYEEEKEYIDLIGDSVKGTGKADIHRGTPFDLKKKYQVELVLGENSLVEMKSEKFQLSTRQSLIISAKGHGGNLDVDLVNQRSCGRSGGIDFSFAQDVRATLSVQSVNANGGILGTPQILFQDQVYSQGSFSHNIDPAQLGSGDFVFTLSATGIADPSQQEQRAGGFSSLFKMHNSLPVGQVIVKGVNLKTGGLVAQTQAIGIPGVGPAFHFQPTYSSGSNGQINTMGANWTHNFDAGLSINSCGEVSVSAGDGGSVRFAPTNDGKLVADKGYHATLVENKVDHSFDFYSKDGTRYHFGLINPQIQWKLAYIEDTNGNRQTLNYDMDAIPAPRLINVTNSDGRQFNLTYAAQKIDRPGVTNIEALVQSVTGPGGLSLKFTYDKFGNLIAVNRNGRTESFAYSTDEIDTYARSLLTSYTDPNGNKTTYTFNKEKLAFTSGGVSNLAMANSMVTTIATPTGNVGFNYDIATLKNSSVTDENGKLTKYTLNAYGSPLAIEDPIGTTRMTWAIDDINMLSKTDARGVKTEYSYDTHGNLLSEKIAGTTITNTYLVQTAAPYIKNRLTSRVDRNGNSTTYTYDERGNRTQESHPESAKISHSYSSNGLILSTTDAMGGVSSFSYDDVGNLKSTKNPIGASQSLTRDARARVVSSTDDAGTTKFDYDDQDQVVSRTDAMGKSRSMSYDKNGNKRTEKDEAGRTTSWTYNALNLPVTITRADGKSKQIDYDNVGNKTAETDFANNTTSYSYDAANRLTKRVEPLGKKTSYTYDEIGNVVSETDALGRITSHSYDELSHRIATVDAAGGNWSMTYDGNGNQLSSTDPLSRITSYDYDGLNRQIKISLAGAATDMAYDKNGNKVRITDRNGHITRHQYDAANRLTSSTDGNGQTTQHSYDKSNNLTQTINANRQVTSHEYDALHRQTATKDGEGYTTRYRYDAVGNLTEETQANGNTISHAYDDLNRLVSTTDRLGQLGAWDYDANGNKITETDANGNTTSHDYNALNYLSKTTAPEGRNHQFTVDLMGNRLSAKDPRGGTTHTIYDDLNRPTEITNALSGSHRISYDKVGNKIQEVDPNGNSTSTTYDELNHPITVTDALSKKHSYRYDKAGNKTSETDKRGITTKYTYDGVNRLLTVSKDGVTITKNQYDDGGNLIFVTDANGNTSNYVYDKRNLRIADNRPLAAITKTVRDAMGDAITVTDPEGRSTTTSYDERRRPTAVTNAAGETTTSHYDGVGNRTSVKRPNGGTTSYHYDAANRLTSIDDAIGGTTSYGYDKSDNHIRISDAQGNQTSSDFDALNRRTQITYPGGATESFTYDANGNLLKHTDGNGIIVSHSYDALNRETAKTYSASADGLTSINISYDNNNNITRVEMQGSKTLISQYSYDNFDRQQQQLDPFGAKVTLSYDANGNQTSLITQDGKVSKYTYDALNRVTSITGQSGTIAYTYDKTGLNTQITYSNGTSSNMRYDAALRMQQVTHAKGNIIHARTDYVFDQNGNRTKETINRNAAAQVTNYSYDKADRLTQTEVIDVNQTVTTAYTLDGVANRTKEIISTKPAGT
ncbi:transglutaminase domain-containing protein, partial [Undibacterium flavidum]